MISKEDKAISDKIKEQLVNIRKQITDAVDVKLVKKLIVKNRMMIRKLNNLRLNNAQE